VMFSKTYTLMSEEERQTATELRERAESIMEAQRQEAKRKRLRDQFAAAALAGILTEDDANAMEWRREQICREAYNWAEAMLDERRRRAVSPEAK
jgi:hypothetical protein